MFRFIHAADLHLDSPLRGLDQYEGAPVDVLRRAGRAALENLVALALEERVRFVVLAGDLFDGDWPDVNTGLFFARQMSRLREAGIAVYLIYGNHDAANRMTRTLPYPENVRIFPPDRPQQFPVDGLPVVVHGQSYARQDVRENLVARYPAPQEGCFNIGLLHTALNGREGHEPYAPCTVEQLLALGYQYWALGHVHQRQSVSPNPLRLIEFPGNIQGRHVREAGAKGCLLVHVDSDQHATTKFQPLDVCRWARVEVDCRDVAARQTLVRIVVERLQEELDEAEGRLLAARIVLRGSCPLHHQLLARREEFRDDIRARATDLYGEQVWIEKLEVRTAAPAADADDSELPEDAFSEIHRVLEELRRDPDTLQGLLDTTDLKHLRHKLPPELRDGDYLLDFSAADVIAELLDQAAALLLDQRGAAEDRP
jgi:DNA repair exonuclease SbcCD nuclease subunit